VGLTDLLRSKLEVGVEFLLYSEFTKTLLGANDDCSLFEFSLDRYNTFKGWAVGSLLIVSFKRVTQTLSA
jgi:hypothetical protein